MSRGIWLFATCVGLAVILMTGTLDAMPLGATKDLGKAVPANVILNVHGCHHFCARGPAGWHRHGPHCGRWAC